jgi:hypothetical protein
VPAGDSGRHKPSADVFSLFSLLLFACSEQLVQESPGRNNNGPTDAKAVCRLIGEAHHQLIGMSRLGLCLKVVEGRRQARVTHLRFQQKPSFVVF